MKRIHSLVLIIILFTSACGADDPPTPSVGTIQTAIAETQAAAPTNTAQPTPTVIPNPTIMPTATTEPTATVPAIVASIRAAVIVEFLNMRSGPSTFFPVVGAFAEGSVFFASSRTSDQKWVKVADADNSISGWMVAEFLEFGGNVISLEIDPAPSSQSIRGQVIDSNGAPVEGVVVAVIGAADTTLRNDVTSGADGFFASFLPIDFVGLLMDVQIVGIDCASRIVNLECNLSGYFQLANRQFVRIPQEEPIIFTYETATVNITGTVLNSRGDALPLIRVVAFRDDGASSFTTSGEDGVFTLPAGDGNWIIYTLTFDPRVEGENIELTITGDTPPLIEVITP